MADYNLTKSWSSIDTITDNADAGNIGKDNTQAANISNLDFSQINAFQSYSAAATNAPTADSGALIKSIQASTGRSATIAMPTASGANFSAYGRAEFGGSYGPWREIYHDNGNGVTASEAATAIKGAKDGNIGVVSVSSTDWQTNDLTGFFIGALNGPEGGALTYGGLRMPGATSAFSTNVAGRGSKLFFQTEDSSVFGAWREIYHDNGNGVTAAEAATAIKDAKDGGINRPLSFANFNYDNDYSGNFYYINSIASGTPPPHGTGVGGLLNCRLNQAQGRGFQINAFDEQISFRTFGASPDSWQELYHTGNTGVVKYKALGATGTAEFRHSSTDERIDIETTFSTTRAIQLFYNPNGLVGSIQTSGTSTAYVTTSDNELKDVIGKPSDEEIDAKFNDIYDTFTLFNWKNGSNEQPVWGFLAWDVVDKGLDFGTERQGPRDLPIGSVYETIPAETEERPIIDEDGNETGEFETVVIKEAIEKRVTPAGVDQSKITAYLVPFAELQRRRIDTLEKENESLKSEIEAIKQHLGI